VFVKRDPTDAPAMLHHRADPPQSVETVDTTVQHVAPDETTRGIPDGTFDQSISARELVHSWPGRVHFAFSFTSSCGAAWLPLRENPVMAKLQATARALRPE